MNEYADVLEILMEKLEGAAVVESELFLHIEDGIFVMQKMIHAEDIRIYGNELCVCQDIWISYPKETGNFVYDKLDNCFILKEDNFCMLIDFNTNELY